AVFDPSMGTQSTIFQRFFDVTAVALFFVMGGHRLLLMGLATSVDVVGLDGNIRLDARLGDLAVQTLARYMLASLEIAVPILSALLLSELVLGVASRLLPQANVFLLGLPLKILVVLLVVTVSVSSFPSIMGWLMEAMEETFTEVMMGLR
ncbi:MAG: flagellar biosynthetic protein FliR, partial [Actinomycetota bacterium]|nr:flagellar biosynthetic protein FliR [Actinomycetota bacterium]